MSKHTTEPSVAPAVIPAAQAPVPTPPGTEPLPAPAPAMEPAPLTEAQIAQLKSEAEKAREWYDQLLRATANLENYKKRAARERHDAVRFANQALLQKLVPVLDNFDAALAAAANGPNTTLEAFRSGVLMIHQQLRAALAEAGLQEIDATRQPFDPNLHEAVSQEDSTEVPEGHVVRQLRKGYKLQERLLRPASVVVARRPASSPETPA